MKNLICVVIILSWAFQVKSQDIYFATEQNSRGRDIVKISADGNKLKKITTTHQSSHYPHNNFPKLSPDRTKILYQCDPDGHDRYSIWVMDLDGSNRTRLTQKEGMYPTWSTDGNTIYFSGRRNGIWEILSIPSGGGPESNVTQHKTKGIRPGWGATMTVSRDAIYFSYVREKTLWKLELQTGIISQISKAGEKYASPSISADGTQLAVCKKVTKGYDLMSYDIKTRIEKRLVTNVVSYSAASWSADDTQLLFTGMVNGNQEIFKIDLKTMEETQLTNNQDFDAMPIW